MTDYNSNRFPVDRKLLARIFSKIKVSTENFYKDIPCWEWQNNKNNKGYGMFSYKCVKRAAHIIIYQLFVEIIPKGLECDHLCRNTVCVNPAHIELVTHSENMMRSNFLSAINARKTVCDYGHEFTERNTALINNKGKIQRRCRKCEVRKATVRYVRKTAYLKQLPYEHPERIEDRRKKALAAQLCRNKKRLI